MARLPVEDLELDYGSSCRLLSDTMASIFACAPNIRCLTLNATMDFTVRTWTTLYKMSGLRVLHLRTMHNLTMGYIHQGIHLLNLESLLIDAITMSRHTRASNDDTGSIAHMLSELPSLRKVGAPFGRCDPIEVIELFPRVNAIMFVTVRADDIIVPVRQYSTGRIFAPNLYMVCFSRIHCCDGTRSVEMRLMCPHGSRFSPSASCKFEDPIEEFVNMRTDGYRDERHQ